MITNTFNGMELVRYLRGSPKCQVTYTTDLRYISQQVCDLLRGSVPAEFTHIWSIN